MQPKDSRMDPAFTAALRAYAFVCAKRSGLEVSAPDVGMNHLTTWLSVQIGLEQIRCIIDNQKAFRIIRDIEEMFWETITITCEPQITIGMANKLLLCLHYCTGNDKQRLTLLYKNSSRRLKSSVKRARQISDIH